MAGLRDFLAGVAEGLPQGVNAFSEIQGVKQRRQALGQGQQALDLKRQEFESGFIPGSDANNRISGLFPTLKINPIFRPEEKVSTKELNDALDALQNRVSSMSQQPTRPYTMPLNRRDPKTGEDLFFNTRTQEILPASQLPGGGQLGVGLVPSLKTLPAGETSELADTQSLEGLLGEIKSTVEKNPSFVGRTSVIEGAKMIPGVKKIQALTGSETLAQDPQAGAFLRNLQSLKTLRSFSLGGKQLTPTEVEQLSKLVPDSNSTIEDFNAQMARFEQEMQRIVSNRQRAFGEVGYTTPGQPSGGPNPPPGPSAPNQGWGIRKL